MQNLPSVYTFPKTSPGKVLCKHTASVADNGVAFAIMRHSTLVTNDLPLVIQPQPLSYERPKYLAAPGIFCCSARESEEAILHLLQACHHGFQLWQQQQMQRQWNCYSEKGKLLYTLIPQTTRPHKSNSQ